jgi:hypothetical protein
VKKVIQAGIMLCAITLLTLEFYSNVFQTVHRASFKWFQKDSESLSAGRLVRSKLEGPFSEGGFLGWNHPDKSLLPANTIQRDIRFSGWGYEVPYHPSKFMFQYEALRQTFPIGHYEKYYSQSGVQSLLYHLLGSVFNISGEMLIAVCRLLNAILLAVVLCGFIWWSACYFGTLAGVLSFTVILLSKWLIVYAGNMLYVTGLFFLPMVAGLWDMHYQLKKGSVSLRRCMIITFTAIFLKCTIAGFDFIIPTLVMAIIPVVFYAVLCNWPIRKSLFFLGAVSAGSLAVVLISLFLLIIQLAIYHHSWSEAVEYIVSTTERRTYGNQHDLKIMFDASRRVSLLQIFLTYLNGYAIDLPYLVAGEKMQIRFLAFLLAFILASLVVVWLPKSDYRRTRGLLIVTWIALAGPLGWFIVFRYHSLSHTHMNFVIWHMPLMLFGTVLVGFVLQQIYHHAPSIHHTNNER